MKTILLLYSIFILTSTCYCQDSDTLYFNKRWKQVSKNENYIYSWTLDVNIDSLSFLKEYYKDGRLQINKAFHSNNQRILIEKFIRYKKDGTQTDFVQYHYDLINDTIKDHLLNKYEELRLLDSMNIVYREFYKSKNYISGVGVSNEAYGVWTFLNDSKELSEKVEYVNGKENGVAIFYLNSIDKVDKSDIGKIWQIGYLKNGKRDSLWTFYEPDNTIYRRITYKNGKKIDDIKY